MKKYLTKERIIIFISILCIVFLFLKLKVEKEKNNDMTNSIDVISKGWELEVNKKDSTISTQKQVIIDKNSKLAKQADTIQGLKNQKQRVRIFTRTLVVRDTVKIPSDQILTFDSIDYIKLPFVFSMFNKWYGYQFTLTRDNVILDSLYLNNELEAIWGVEDHGFIKNLVKANYPIVSIVQKNPFSKTTEVNNYTFKDYKKKRFSLSGQVGYGITNAGFSPYAGFGLSINL